MTVPDVITTPLHYLFESNLTMAINAMSCTMFLANLYHSTVLLHKNRKPIYQLCFAQSLIGLVVNLLILGGFFQFDVSCPFRVNFAAAGNLISTTCIESILLIKAKLATSTLHPAVVYVGAVLLGFKIAAFVANIAFTTIIVTPLYNCGVLIVPTVGGVAVAMELAVNIYLSAFFLTIIYRQWRFMRLFLYESLFKDGLAYSLVTAVTSTTMVVLVFTNVLGTNSAALFNISWVVASTLTVLQLRNALRIKEQRRPNKQPQDSSRTAHSQSRIYRDKVSQQKNFQITPPGNSSHSSNQCDSIVITVNPYDSNSEAYELSPEPFMNTNSGEKRY